MSYQTKLHFQSPPEVHGKSPGNLCQHLHRDTWDLEKLGWRAYEACREVISLQNHPNMESELLRSQIFASYATANSNCLLRKCQNALISKTVVSPALSPKASLVFSTLTSKGIPFYLPSATLAFKGPLCLFQTTGVLVKIRNWLPRLWAPTSALMKRESPLIREWMPRSTNGFPQHC